MPESRGATEGQKLRTIRDWVPHIGAQSGDVLEVKHGPRGGPIYTVGACDIRVRSAKDTGSITGLRIEEMIFTPQVRIHSMRIVSRKETEADI